MLKNEVFGPSSTVLKEINHDIYKDVIDDDGLSLGVGSTKPHHVTGSDNVVANMTVASNNHHGGVPATAERPGEESTSGNSAKELYQ